MLTSKDFSKEELKLIPRPNRLDEHGWREALYLRALLDYMYRTPGLLADYLPGATELSDRQKRICLAIFRWFGTNNGEKYLKAARKLGNLYPRWNGKRFKKVGDWNAPSLDDLLDERNISPFSAFTIEAPTDQASAEDYQTADAFAQWLDSPDSVEMLDSAEKKVQAVRTAESNRIRALCNLPPI